MSINGHSFALKQSNAVSLISKLLQEFSEPLKSNMETVGRGLLAMDERTREDFVDGRTHERNPLIFGKSEKIKEIETIVSQVANTDITVLIRGESGTGKELIAREICARSSRN